MEKNCANSWCISYTNAQHLTLDGIPIQLNERLIPKSYEQEDVTVGISTKSKVLQQAFEYNFETEDGFLEYHKAFLKEKNKEEQHRKTIKKEKQRIPKLSEPKPAMPIPATSDVEKQSNNVSTFSSLVKRHSKPLPPPPATKPSVPHPPASNPSTGSIVNNTSVVLTPQRVGSPIPQLKPLIPAVSTSSMELSDFEGKAEDPFEIAELNTINEKEMLRDILGCSFSTQTIVNPVETVDVTSTQPFEVTETSNNVQAADDHDTRPLPPTPDQPSRESHIPSSPLSDQLAPNQQVLGHSTPDQSTIDTCVSLSENTGSVNYKLKVVPGKKPRPAVKPKPVVLSTVTVSKEMSPATPFRRRHHSMDDNMPTENMENIPKPVKPELFGFSYTEDIGNVMLKKTTRNSFPLSVNHDKPTHCDQLEPHSDKSESLNHELVSDDDIKPTVNSSLKTKPLKFTNLKSTTPPPRPEKTYNIQRPAPPPPRMKSGQPPRHLQSKEPAPTNIKQTDTAPMSLEKNGLNSNWKSTGQAETFANMGFEKELINTAIQHYGDDNEKVLDHLINLQGLTVNSGLSGSIAQDALLLYPTNRKQADQYMSSCKKLLEYGFKLEDIRTALQKSNLNDDAALDILCNS